MAHNYEKRTIVRGTALKSKTWSNGVREWTVTRRVKTAEENSIWLKSSDGKATKIPANAFHFMLKNDMLRKV